MITPKQHEYLADLILNQRVSSDRNTLLGAMVVEGLGRLEENGLDTLQSAEASRLIDALKPSYHNRNGQILAALAGLGEDALAGTLVAALAKRLGVPVTNIKAADFAMLSAAPAATADKLRAGE